MKKNMNTHKEQILIVEDDPHIGQFLCEELAEQGYEVQHAMNGTAALQMIEGKKFDLILADYRMPEMNGLEMLKELNTLGSLVPVVFLTGYGDVEVVSEALRRGAYDFLMKPITTEELNHSLSRALNYSSVIDQISDAVFSLDIRDMNQEDIRKALFRLSEVFANHNEQV